MKKLPEFGAAGRQRRALRRRRASVGRLQRRTT
jgi:hypothetical protein